MIISASHCVGDIIGKITHGVPNELGGHCTGSIPSLGQKTTGRLFAMPLNEKMKLDRSEYGQAQGYDVDVMVTYQRTRKVRALDAEQAASFAAEREREFAQRYFNANAHIAYEVINAEAVATRPSSERRKKQVSSG